MNILLYLLATWAVLYGASIFSSAESSIHEIEALMLFLIAAVFISGAAVVGAVNSLGGKTAVAEVVNSLDEKTETLPINSTNTDEKDISSESTKLQQVSKDIVENEDGTFSALGKTFDKRKDAEALLQYMSSRR